MDETRGIEVLSFAFSANSNSNVEAILHPPNWMLWINFFLVLFMATIFLSLLGWISFYMVEHDFKHKAYFYVLFAMTYTAGVFSPALVMDKFKFLTSSKMLFSMISIINHLKLLEVLMKTYPSEAARNMKSWLVYFSSMVEPSYDNGNPSKAKPGQKTKYIKLIIFKILLGSILVSVGMNSNPKFLPFGDINKRTNIAPDNFEDFKFLFLNNALHTFVFYFIFGTLANIVALMLTIVGYQAKDFFRNPFLLSKSPRDFWGNRWNLTIHGILKRSYFEPVKKRFGTKCGSFVAFMVSGLFHEVLWCMAFKIAPNGFHHFGMVLKFFLMMFLLCCLPWPDQDKIKNGSWLLTLATIIPGLCVAHYFFGAFLNAELFEEVGKLFPYITLEGIQL
mmetsp:Transcript_18551/g.26150  ORF Transcript_18551/g.26150 Transcript_18551/m.26150 type:complete len:391 (-) Transcript_18551:4-1176(-)